MRLCSPLRKNFAGEFIMGYNKRGFLEILAEILNSLSDGELIKTHITFKCKLDSRAVAKYLNILLKNGLIRKLDKENTLFMITKKGSEFLMQYNKLMSLINVLDIPNLEKSDFSIRTQTIQ
jgi:predicted transcriptional regulator